MTVDSEQKIAADLRAIYETGEFCDPIRDRLAENDIDAAYRIQEINTQFWLGQGRRLTGRKIGLTSKAVQQQLGVNQPDFGMLFADMACSDGEDIPCSRLQQPKIEGEIAFVLGEHLDNDNLTLTDIINSIDYAIAAFEIVGSRIKDWNISIVDTIADNASSSLYVLGAETRRLGEFDLRLCGAVIESKSEPVSTGAGAACLGNPVNAVLWLANKMVAAGRPLQSGDLVLSGALCPFVDVQPGDTFTLRISGLGSVRANFS